MTRRVRAEPSEQPRLARRAPGNSLSSLGSHWSQLHSSHLTPGSPWARHSQDKGEMIECSETDNFRQGFCPFQLQISSSGRERIEATTVEWNDSANNRVMSFCWDSTLIIFRI